MARRRTRAATKPNRPVAIVTGAANGIGRAISHHLLDAGWCVLAVDLPKTRLIQHFRGWARSSATMEGDVSDEDVVQEVVRFALDRFGRLDAVVANADTSAPSSSAPSPGGRPWYRHPSKWLVTSVAA